MKKLMLIITLISLSALADGYRTFTAEDGRTLTAKVIAYDGTTDKVEIQREDNKKLTVKSSVFSKKDQTYIKSWSATGIYTSASKFKLKLSRNEIKSTKKEHDIDLGEEFGGGRRGGGDTGVQTVAIDKNTQYKFDLLLENKGDVPLKTITMEYRIYYEQEKAVKDEKANKNRSEDDSRPERYIALSENKVSDGKIRLETIDPGESKEISIGNVTIMKRSASRAWGDKIDLKGKLAGAWVKLTMKDPDGTKVVREIAYPESIMKKYPWDPEEEEQQQSQKAKLATD